jgi:uncharacterized protein (TIGR03000 family)
MRILMNRWFLTSVVAAVSLLALVPQRGEAQRSGGWRGGRHGRAYSAAAAGHRNGGGYQFGGVGVYGYYSPDFYSTTTPFGSYADGEYPASSPGAENATESYQANYPPTTEDEDAQGSVARVTVRLPDPKAELWFNGKRMDLRGVTRTFTTPPLILGQDYHYVVRVRWMKDGRALTTTRTVNVLAGQPATVDFRKGGPGKQGAKGRLPAAAGNVDRNPREPGDLQPPVNNIRRPADTNPQPQQQIRRPGDTNQPVDNDKQPAGPSTRPAPGRPSGD